jgi:hypothetical protein
VRGDILEWFKTYLTDRKQKVVSNNTESEVGCLYAGVPRGSVLGPILFLIYINDITDHTDGICRIFADDTSLGHTSNDLQNLQDMINSGLSNIKKWSEDWLITFNPDKTDIMLFDSRRQGNLNFKFGQTDILSVDFHKHLGIVFSSDGKWTRHIDYILFKASKQLCVLRKLKFILKREILEKIYLTFIRPLLEYSCEVWDNYSQTDNDRLEKLQLEAARIVTGLTAAYSSRDSVYQETGLGKIIK